jgi:hypothetical protein
MADDAPCWLCRKASEVTTRISTETFVFLQEIQEGVETGEKHEYIRLGKQCRKEVSRAKTAIAGNVRTARKNCCVCSYA